MRIISAFVVLMVLSLTSTPVAAEETATQGGATPEEVFESALEANRQRDMQALVALVAPSERGMVVIDLFDGAAMMCGQDPEGGKVLCEVLHRHGLEAAMANAAEAQEAEAALGFNERMAHQMERASTTFAEVDVPRFADELGSAFVALGAPDDDELFTFEGLDSMEVDGDNAVGRESEREIEFLREEGRWYLRWRAVL